MNYDEYYEEICQGIHKINNALHEAYHEDTKDIYKKLVKEFPSVVIAINCLSMNEHEERYQGPVTMKCILCEEEGHIGIICPKEDEE